MAADQRRYWQGVRLHDAFDAIDTQHEKAIWYRAHVVGVAPPDIQHDTGASLATAGNSAIKDGCAVKVWRNAPFPSARTLP